MAASEASMAAATRASPSSPASFASRWDASGLRQSQSSGEKTPGASFGQTSFVDSSRTAASSFSVRVFLAGRRHSAEGAAPPPRSPRHRDRPRRGAEEWPRRDGPSGFETLLQPPQAAVQSLPDLLPRMARRLAGLLQGQALVVVADDQPPADRREPAQRLLERDRPFRSAGLVAVSPAGAGVEAGRLVSAAPLALQPLAAPDVEDVEREPRGFLMAVLLPASSSSVSASSSSASSRVMPNRLKAMPVSRSTCSRSSSRATAASGPVLGVSASLVTAASARILLSAPCGCKETGRNVRKRTASGNDSDLFKRGGSTTAGGRNSIGAAHPARLSPRESSTRACLAPHPGGRTRARARGQPEKRRPRGVVFPRFPALHLVDADVLRRGSGGLAPPVLPVLFRVAADPVRGGHVSTLDNCESENIFFAASDSLSVSNSSEGG